MERNRLKCITVLYVSVCMGFLDDESLALYSTVQYGS